MRTRKLVIDIVPRVTDVKGARRMGLHNAPGNPDRNAMQVRPDHTKAMARKALLLGFLSSVTLFAFADSFAAELDVAVTDASGQPVPDSVVIATAQRTPPAVSNPAPAVMDQIGKAFVPEVIVGRTGTPVVFPNSDSVAHQVYSFSPAKHFELGLYRGDPHPPVVFDHAGLVVVGCNIHDNMVGYIVVTDSPYFGKADKGGAARLTEVPAGEYDVTIWSPRLPRNAEGLKQHVRLSDAATAHVEFRLKQAMQAGAAQQNARVREY
jgi:plastocyanin